jgi:hypothetical protein|nr:hypothetical protein [Kofleriaceae bacterium]
MVSQRTTCRLAVAASLVVWGYGVMRVEGAAPVTLPHVVTWHDHDDTTITPSDEYFASPCQRTGRDFVMVVGSQVIASCEHGRDGWAVVEPGLATGHVRWRLPDDMRDIHAIAVAPRADGEFGIAFETTLLPRFGTPPTDPGERGTKLVVALAGPDGWLVEPEVIGNRDVAQDLSDVLAMSWTADGSAVEAVVTAPVAGTGNDPFGLMHAPVIVRLTPGQPVARTVAPYPATCDCTLRGALPGPRGWTIIASAYDGRRDTAKVVSPTGELADAPESLAMWVDGSSLIEDRAALGVIGDGLASLVVERDGTRHPASFGDGTPFSARPLVLGADGVLRRTDMTMDNDVVHATVDGHPHVLEQREDMFTIDGAPIAKDLSFAYDLAFVPAPPEAGGGYYLVTADGSYVTLDRDFHRIDPQSLSEHLRTRGSVGAYIHEASHVTRLYLFVAGLPFLLLVGWLGARSTGARVDDAVPAAIIRGRVRTSYSPIIGACVMWLAFAWWTLGDLLPLLR